MSSLRNTALRLLLLGVTLSIWEAAVRALRIPSFILPPPSEIGAALYRGAVREVVDDGVTGIVFDDEAAMAAGLPRVFALDRRRVRARGIERFGTMRMVDEYVAIYERLIQRAAEAGRCETVTR